MFANSIILGETQEELVNLRLISKQLYEDCKRPGIEWKIFISMIEISPIHGGGSMEGIVQKFWHHLMDNSTDKKLRRCFRVTVVDAYKFYSNPMTLHEVKGMIKFPRMDWILSLDMSLLVPLAVAFFYTPYRRCCQNYVKLLLPA